MATMKALRLTRPSPDIPPTLALTTLPIPSVQPEHLLIKVRASAIHPSDLLNSRGLFPYTTFPRVPGRDFSGVISQPSARAGEEVFGTSGFTQAFTVDGAQAEYILVPEDAVSPKPKNLSWVQAATVGVPFTTASTVLLRTRVERGEKVLVLGANGAVGSAVVQLAVSLGAVVLKGTRDDKGDLNTAADPALTGLDSLTDGKGVNVVIDTVGQPSLTKSAIAKLTKGGRLGFIAAPRSGDETLGIEMTAFYRKDLELVGVNTLNVAVATFAKELESMAKKFEEGVLVGAKEGEWTEVKLEDGVHGYEKAGKKGEGKFVIVM